MILLAACAFGLSQVAPGHTLWQIGEFDGSGAEFSLAPDRYSQYRTDPAFAVGTSSVQSWPYVLPGPEDSWAGSRVHHDSVFFCLKGKTAPCRLVCGFVDTQRISPPHLAIWINGKNLATWQSSAGAGDASIFGHPESGKHSTWAIDIPASALKLGLNELQIRNDRGSWALFDALRFESPSPLELAPVSPGLRVAVGTQDQIVLRTSAGPRQPIALNIVNFGPKAKLDITGDAKWSGSVENGAQSVTIQIAPVHQTRKLRIHLAFGKISEDQTVDVQPVRPWSVYLLPHSHVDIGYTDVQPVVAAMHRRNLFDAISVANESAQFPSDDRYRFNDEATWILDNLKADGSPEELRKVASAFKAGIIDGSANYCNVLTGLMRPEELIRSYGYSTRLRSWLGRSLTTASQTDVPGVTWGAVAAMSQAGIRNLILMPNPSDRIGGVLSAWQDRPFYWVSPSGKERVLVWETTSYGTAHGLRHFNGDRTKIFRTSDPTANFIEGYVFERLRRLNSEGYPYDCIGLPWSGTDNFPIDADVAKAARHWNETYVTPHVVVSTFTSACEHLVEKFGSKIPIVKGDFSPYWEDGAGSSAFETSLNRASADRLVQAETLCAIDNPSQYDPSAFWSAWRNVILYSEHTWGAFNSTSDPDSPFVKAQWKIKQGFAIQADRKSKELLDRLTASVSGAEFSIANANSWPRTDLVVLTKAQSLSGDRVIDSKGHPLPSQRLRSGDLAILAQNVPAFGSIKLRVVSGTAFTERKAFANARRISSPDWNIEIAEGSLKITKMWNVRLNRDFAKPPYDFNRYYRLPGSDLKGLESAKLLRCEVVEPGPLVASIRISGQATGTRGITQEVRLVAGLDRVDFTNRIDKIAVRAKEGVHFAFPFSVPNGQLRIQGPWAVIRPDVDQIAGSNKNWLNTQYFADVSNDSYGITWSSLDAPLMEVSGITANMLDGGFNPDQWIHRLGPTQTIYSWALNNHWYTNYKADQEGLLTFRYCVRAHGKYAPEQAYAFGAGLAQPLIATRPTRTAPLLTVSNPRVVVSALKPSEDKRAIIVRLWCMGDKPAKFKLAWRTGAVGKTSISDSSELSKSTCSGEIPIAGWQVLTLRSELAK